MMDDMEEKAAGPEVQDVTTGARQADEAEKQLVAKVQARIEADKRFHEPAYKRMERDMRVARIGADENWPENAYTVNLTGRHINQKTANLYAKNPEAVVSRRPRMDFALWDENPRSLTMAMEAIKLFRQSPEAQYGMPPPPPVMQAEQIVQDAMQGLQRRQQLKKIGETLKNLFGYFMDEQQPVDFKVLMKGVVRRAGVCGAAFVDLGFERSYRSDPTIQRRLSDIEQRLNRLRTLNEKIADDDTTDRDMEIRQLELSMQSLQDQEMVIDREGLVFDAPAATKVIPDQLCTSLVGFIGARWVTVEYSYSPDDFRDVFGFDAPAPSRDDDVSSDAEEGERSEQVTVYKMYDKAAGLVYFVTPHHDAFLIEPGAPDVRVDGFWPILAITFNEVEDPQRSVFPPSDVTLMADMQKDYNAARQGQREHRQAARPRYVAPQGILSDENKRDMEEAEPFSVTELAIPQDRDIRQVIQQVPMAGVDPNLYTTAPTFDDIQVSVGAQESHFGGVAKATATETSIAEGSRVSAVGSNVDDLDSFLTRIARASGQILLNEMSVETVKKIVGVGAVWPDLSADEISEEIFLDVKAGSSGKPNQAHDIANWQKMMPFLVQMPGIDPVFLAKETLRRLDDRLPLTEALASNALAMVAQNQLATAAGKTGGAAGPGVNAGAGQGPGADPAMQGGQGGMNAPAAPGGPVGTEGQMGNNQV